MANLAPRRRATILQFAPPTSNGVAVQASDLCQPDNASATILERKKPGKESPRMFVGRSNEMVDPTMLPSQRTMRV